MQKFEQQLAGLSDDVKEIISELRTHRDDLRNASIALPEECRITLVLATTIAYLQQEIRALEQTNDSLEAELVELRQENEDFSSRFSDLEEIASLYLTIKADMPRDGRA